MIELLKNFRYAVLGLCGFSIFVGIFRLCIPKGFKSLLMFVSEMFVIAVIIFPLFKPFSLANFDFNISTTDYSDLNLQEEMETNEIKLKLKELITEKLKEAGINPTAIGIDITVLENKITIDCAELTVSKQDFSKCLSLKDQLEGYFNFPFSFKIEEGD